jgi:holo-[acyl-carrier protein] synthase
MGEVISIGVDLVDVRDVASSIARFGDRYLARVFTPREIAYATSAIDPATTARRLGARFAAKEATLKALRACERGISPRAIEVVRSEDGGIELALHGPAFAAARDASATLALTMSHEGQLAVAIVIATWCSR